MVEMAMKWLVNKATQNVQSIHIIFPAQATLISRLTGYLVGLNELLEKKIPLSPLRNA